MPALQYKNKTKKQYMQLWREKNKEYVYQYGKQYRKVHYKEIRLNWRNWWLKNKKLWYQYSKKYSDSHREAMRLNQKNWRLRHLEKARLEKRIYMRDYNKREEVKEKQRLWKLENPNYSKEKQRLWRLKNPNYYNSKERRIKKKAENALYKERFRNGGKLTIQDIQKVYEDNIKKYGTLTCYLCYISIQFGEDSIDHKTPLSRGGTNVKENLDIAHFVCNCRKHNRTEEEYRILLKNQTT